MNITQDRKMHRIEFNSLEEFYDYITKTPFNETFRWARHSSVESTKEFTETENFEEAIDLFKHGWNEMTDKLNNRLKAEGKFEQALGYKSVYSVQGFHPVIPLYLMGVPNNMVTRKMIPMKQKVVTLNKSVSYSYKITTNQIIDESIKALKLIKKLESQNYRVNLNVVLGVVEPTFKNVDKEKYFIKIKIKSASEKMNISKISFPLVHPSMLRRLFFRFEEVYPTVSEKFKTGYGVPANPQELRAVWPDDILLPQFINKDIESINTLDDLENL